MYRIHIIRLLTTFLQTVLLSILIIYRLTDAAFQIRREVIHEYETKYGLPYEEDENLMYSIEGRKIRKSAYYLEKLRGPLFDNSNNNSKNSKNKKDINEDILPPKTSYLQRPNTTHVSEIQQIPISYLDRDMY